MTDNAFDPAVVTMPQGCVHNYMNAISWDYAGTGQHTVTADDNSFDSSPHCPPECLPATRYVNLHPANESGAGSEIHYSYSYDFALRPPGTYRYHCKIHGGPEGKGMAGTIVITDDV